MAMRFEDERYVRIYPRRTPTTERLGWEGRVVLRETLLCLDRAGLLSLSGEQPADAVALVTGLPVELCRVGLARCFEKNCLIHIEAEDGYLLAPRYQEAQEALHSNRMRSRGRRERRAARVRFEKLTSSHPEIAAQLQQALRQADDDDDCSHYQTDTRRVGGPSDPGQSDATRDVSVATRDVSVATRDVSDPTPEDTRRPPLHCIAVHCIEERESRARARTHAHGTSESADRPTNGGTSVRTDHPDNRFLDDAEISPAEFCPPDWLAKEAAAAGLSSERLQGVLDVYRAESDMGMASRAKHARAFAKWVKRECARTNERSGSEASGNRTDRRGGTTPGESPARSSPRAAERAARERSFTSSGHQAMLEQGRQRLQSLRAAARQR